VSVASGAPGTRLLAAVVLSACIGLIGGGLGAWGVYTHFGPVERVITETTTGGGATSTGDLATAVQPSLITVSTQVVTPAQLAAGGSTGLAEGFAVSCDGLIVTSAKAVRGASRLRVATADGKGYDATIAGTDVADGIVLLRAAGATGMSPLRMSSQQPRIGDLAVAAYHPAQGTLTARSGVIAAVGLQASDGTVDLGDLVAVDAAAAPDAEGAPLVDGTGAVVGVVTVLPSTAGIVAASGRDISALITAAQRGSAVAAATFGVTSVIIDASAAAALSLPQGALVRSVSASGPAVGLLAPGDVVVSVNGTAVTSVSSLQPSSFGLLAGDRATMLVAGVTGVKRTVALAVAGV
jgi:S1-C subfamily serine protease